jgi:hypothetical protein
MLSTDFKNTKNLFVDTCVLSSLYQKIEKLDWTENKIYYKTTIIKWRGSSVG